MKTLSAILSWIIPLLMPLALIGLSIRILLTPLFPNIEYRLPYFPPDPYGFSTQDRLTWGQKGIDYLMNSADISFLGDLKFPDGSPLFNERELSHMHDVKRVVQGFLRIWNFDLLVLLLLGVWAWRWNWLPTYRLGMKRGGWLTLGIGLIIVVIATIGAMGTGDMFWSFFVWFHGLFFTGDSWLFLDSDSLIRLYPLNFWQDAVLYIALISVLGALGLAFGLKTSDA